MSVLKCLRQEERTMVFVDGANLYSTTRLLGYDVDYSKFLELFQGNCRLIRVDYYTAIRESSVTSKLRPVLDWMTYNGYHVITKQAREFTDESGVTRTKGNMDIELAVGMLTASKFIDHAILVSGDGDFRCLVQAVQSQGVRVSVMSSVKTSQPIMSDDLRRQADSFIDLYDLREHISRIYQEPQS